MTTNKLNQTYKYMHYDQKPYPKHHHLKSRTPRKNSSQPSQRPYTKKKAQHDFLPHQTKTHPLTHGWRLLFHRCPFPQPE